ncbi:acyl carrier protein [Streptomyces sp. NPDC056149]|uniref:acyl carrier protein n=1 Tax=unclassified Streptomyces TaxID=2593676 RepID=UPI0023817F03|nr:acyl carrier protein [Streptomyces sp. WZ-12]
MPDTIETAARSALAEVLPQPLPPEDIDADAQLDHLGLTSLNKVLFLTSLCDRVQVGLHHFTEHDLAAMRTLGQVVAALSRHAEVS